MRRLVAAAVPVLAGLLNLMARGGMTGSQALRQSVDALAKVVTVDHRLRQQLDEADAAVTNAETAAGEVRGRRQGRGQGHCVLCGCGCDSSSSSSSSACRGATGRASGGALDNGLVTAPTGSPDSDALCLGVVGWQEGGEGGEGGGGADLSLALSRVREVKNGLLQGPGPGSGPPAPLWGGSSSSGAAGTTRGAQQQQQPRPPSLLRWHGDAVTDVNCLR
eukprot:COSAG01_NODE_15639_length_1315_cov_47.510691_1_plen_220_part_00